ncbi:hypothetical protein [Candidatus Poriferisodalis sp.]|uniref:hypothetical protein n=1 Tax=Candidatus Poriferisodalis sp. TaxID=3101277 RepID=UPI003AF5BC98
MAPQSGTAAAKHKKTVAAPVSTSESTPDPDGDLEADRFTRYETSGAFVASLEERS